MPTRYLDFIQPRTKLAIWAWSPVIVLRVSLVSVYLLYGYASVIAFLAGVPVFTLVTPQGWTPVWAAFLGISAFVSAFGSITDRWAKVEKWASLFLSSMILTYVVALNSLGFIEHDLDRQFVGAIALIAAVLPVTRYVYLLAQSGKLKHRDVLRATHGRS